MGLDRRPEGYVLDLEMMPSRFLHLGSRKVLELCRPAPEARGILGPGPYLCPEQAVVLETDPLPLAEWRELAPVLLPD